MAPQLIINGKFLSVGMTGVHRVARELTNALAEISPDGLGGGAEIWMPYDAAPAASTMRLPSRVVGPLRGIAWEQVTLPAAARGKLLLNLCNIAPAAATDAVTMIHDAQVYLTPGSYSAPFRAWYKLVQPVLGRRHRHLLTVSEYSKGQLVAAGLAEAGKISVVHNGVDHILSVPAECAIVERLGLARRAFAVALASTQPHKNIRLLLDAFADPAMRGLKLVLVGGGAPDFGTPIPPNVVLAGRVTNGELRALYESALCVAFPSTTEGFGLPPLEGMRVGCPAIVAPRGALPEVCGDATIYAPPDSPRAWVSAILHLASDQSAWLARSRVSEAHASGFTWARSAERLLGVLEALCGERARTRRPERAAA